jgi:hypothetical protein
MPDARNPRIKAARTVPTPNRAAVALPLSSGITAAAIVQSAC